MSFVTDYQYKMPITIDHTKIDSDLIDWTLVFDQDLSSKLTAVNGPLDADGDRPSINGGGDIRFSSDAIGASRLACDIRDWSTNNTPASATCEVAVKVGSISSAFDTTIYMWWGKAGESQPSASDTYGQYNAYDDNYELVLPNGASSDRTSNQRSTTDNSITSGDNDGPTGKATDYEGNNSQDRCEIGDTSDWNTILSYDHAFSIEIVAQKSGSPSVPTVLISKIWGDTAYRGVSITHDHSSNNVSFIIQDTHTPSTIKSSQENNSVNWTSGQWRHLGMAYDGTSGDSTGIAPYYNGSGSGFSGSDSGVLTDTSHPDPLLIGSRNWGAPSTRREWDGLISEVRISSVERDSAWMVTSSYNLLNVAGFLTLGDVEEKLSNNYQYKMPITIDHTKIDTDLTNWTLVFDQGFSAKLTSVNGPLDADGTRPSINGGGDIRFSSDSDGAARLACDIRDWSTNNTPGSATCEVAVKVNSVSSSSDTTIYMWWGKAGETQPDADTLYGQYNAYDSDYIAVWSDGGGADRTGNGNDGTAQNGIVAGDSAGQIGDATDYDSSSSEYFSHSPLGVTADEMSVEVLVNPDDLSGGDTFSSTNPRFVISGNSDAAEAPYLFRLLGDKIQFAYRNSANTSYNSRVTDSGYLSTGSWHHVAVAHSTSVVGLYYNGDSKAATTTVGDMTDTTSGHEDTVIVGAQSSNKRFFDGKMDELRVSSIVRSADWIKANYNNQMNTSGFLTFGDIENVGASLVRFQALIII
jgi:hypothetical protein